MDYMKVTTGSSKAINTSQRELIGKRDYMSLGVQRFARCIADGTHQMITGESLGLVSMELETVKAQLKMALAKTQEDKVLIDALLQSKRDADAEIIWRKDQTRTTALSLRGAETAYMAEISRLTEDLKKSDLRFTEVESQNASLHKRVDGFQDEMKESQRWCMELSKSENNMYDKLCSYRAAAEKAKGKTEGLELDISQLKEENRRLRERVEHMEMVGNGELRRHKEKDLLIESLRSEVKAKDILVKSLWSEVYEPAENSLQVRRLREAETRVEALSMTLLEKESTIIELDGRVKAAQKELFEKKWKQMQSEARITALQASNEDLTLQNATLREEVLRFYRERLTTNREMSRQQQAATDREFSLREMIGRARVCLLQSVARISQLQRHQAALRGEASRALQAKAVIIDDLHFKLAVMTPIPQADSEISPAKDKSAGFVKDLSRQIECLKAENDELREDVADLHVETRVLGENVSMAESRRVSLLQSKLEKAVRDREYIISVYENREAELNGQVECLKQDLDVEVETRSVLEGRVKGGEVDSLRSAAKISQLQKRNEALEGVVKDGAESLEKANSMVRELNAEVMGLKSTIGLLERVTKIQPPSLRAADNATDTPLTAKVPQAVLSGSGGNSSGNGYVSTEPQTNLPPIGAPGRRISTYMPVRRPQAVPHSASSRGHNWVVVSGQDRRRQESRSGSSTYQCGNWGQQPNSGQGFPHGY